MDNATSDEKIATIFFIPSMTDRLIYELQDTFFFKPSSCSLMHWDTEIHGHFLKSEIF